ncbi:hypothetical protein CCAE64S_01143 [Castellaniella caeni]
MLDYQDLTTRFACDLVAMCILLFCIYYPRHRHKDTVISAALLNVFTFAVLSVLSSVQFSITAGFGLFAILALFSLRSEQLSRRDVSYVFGSISLTVITSIQGTSLALVLSLLGATLLASYVFDHPRLLTGGNQMRIRLDFIPKDIASNPQALNQACSERLGVHVVST